LAEKSEAKRPFVNNGRKQKIIRKTLNNMWSQLSIVINRFRIETSVCWWKRYWPWISIKCGKS